MMTDTQELLANFVRNGSEPAFRELVTRYLDLVYSTALRLVDGDTHRAEDVSQIVFADLARMARKLSGSTMLGGWLHRHTCFVARTVMRGERRRQVRERRAVEMKELNDQNDSVLAQIAPILDEAIQELGADDRDAILLRFFERRNLRSVGEALGTTENVAQKRVSRALHELEILLRRDGIGLSAAALTNCLAVGAIKAAPAGLALSIAGSVLGGAGAAGGTGLTSAKIALMAKLKIGIVGALVVAGVVTVILFQNRSKTRLPESAVMAQQQAQPDSQDSDSRPASEEIGRSSPNQQLRQARIEASPIAEPGVGIVGQPARRIVAVPEKTVADNPVPPLNQRFSAKAGSRVRITGTSNVHDWLVEGPLIGGFLEVGPGFPVEPGQKWKPGPVQAQAEAFVVVRSLRSIDGQGRPFSDKMDELIYEALKAGQNPRIYYHLAEISLRGASNNNNVIQYEFDSQGELVLAGITNEITMPVFVVPLGGGKLKISGSTSLKLTDFQIDPGSIALSLIQSDDEVSILFDWVVASSRIPSPQSEKGMVPLILNLPSPAFKGTPNDLRLGPNVEPLSDKPRAAMMVPAGLRNLAPGSRLTSSDQNASPATLAKLTDGNKDASDQSIIFLRKGLQWVQMDLGSLSDIFALVIWHAHNTAKVYHNMIVQIADDAAFLENVRTVFNNDSRNASGLGAGANREYFESYEGKLINCQGVKGRYVRFYSQGSTESALNEYTEIEVYGR